MKFRKIFVTVGTTQFNDLINKLQTDEVYEILKNHLKCEEMKIQIGKGEKINFDNFKGIKVEIFDLKDSIAKDIEEADLVSLILLFHFRVFHFHEFRTMLKVKLERYIF